jgi:hypothetical protein
MDFQSEHTDYNLGFALTFKCIFVMISFQYFFIRTQYMIHDGNTNMN